MAHPRFALVERGGRPGSSTGSWPYGVQLVGQPAPDGAWFAWRLLGGNNRELGRSAQVYPTADQCRSSAATARAMAGQLTSVLSLDVDLGRWRWRVDEGTEVIAVSARMFLRQRECAYNFAQFLVASAAAALWGSDGAEPPAPVLPADVGQIVIDLTDPAPTRGRLSSIGGLPPVAGLTLGAGLGATPS